MAMLQVTQERGFVIRKEPTPEQPQLMAGFKPTPLQVTQLTASMQVLQYCTQGPQVVVLLGKNPDTQVVQVIGRVGPVQVAQLVMA